MAESQGASSAGEGQAPGPGAPQAGTQAQPSGQAPSGTQPAQPTPTSDDPDAGLSEAELREALKRTRGEAAGYRVKVKEFEDRSKADADAKLSEQERLTKERDEARAALQEREGLIRSLRLQQQVAEAATKAGFRNPDVAYRLLDTERLEVDDTGRAKGLDAELKRLLEREPYLARSAGNGADWGGGPRGGAGSGVDMDDLIRRGAGRRG